MTSFALIGLGKMGANMARRLALGGVRAALFDQNPQTATALAGEIGGFAASSLSALVNHLEAPRVVEQGSRACALIDGHQSPKRRRAVRGST